MAVGVDDTQPLPCAFCGTALPGGAKFCPECGRPVRGGASRADASAPRAYTPAHLIDKILSARGTLEGERKQVTVLFADVKGSMELAEQLDPEEWHHIMDRFFVILADGVHRFEGSVNQFTGDGIMALFGAPIAHEDHALRACHAALYLTEALRGYAHQLRRDRGLDFAVRIGLNSGEVVVGRIGDDLRMDYTAQGHTVGLAARMEQLAEAGSVYVTEHTAALAAGFFRFADLGLFTVKGVREPLRVHALQGVGELRTRLDLSRTRGFSRFVGRAAERETLEDAWRRAVAGAAPIVGVVATPGTGKSRLCFEFVAGCRARATVVEAHGVAHGRRVAFLTVRELLRHLFGVADPDEPRVAREKIAGRLLLLDAGLRDLLPVAFDFLGIAEPDRPPLALDPALRQQRLVEMVRRVLAAAVAPVVLLWEDVHWLDEGSEAFLRALVEALAGTRTLILLSLRPEYERGWLPALRYRELALPPLDAPAVNALLDELLGTSPDLAALAARIRERTLGNPFFIEETILALAERGALRGARGAYTLAEAAPAIAIPPSVEAVLAGRLDRLGEVGKAVLQTAAVIGREFDVAELQRASDVPAHELGSVMQALVEAEFVHAIGGAPARYAFKHPLTQEVAERSQLAEARAARHAAVARAMEALAPQRLDERAALLADHWERAGDRLAAARWQGRAAAAIGGTDPREALEHWRRARALLMELPVGPERDALLLTVCIKVMLIGAGMAERTEDPRQLYDEARALAERVGDPLLTGRLLAVYALTVALAGELAPALELVREAERLAEQTGDPGLVVSVADVAVQIYGWLGHPARALDVCERAIALARDRPELGGGGRLGRLVLEAAFVLGTLGRLNEADAKVESAAEQAERTNDVELRGLAELERGRLLYLRGENQASLAHTERAMEIGANIGSGAILGPALTMIGTLHCLLGRWDAAVNTLEMIAERTKQGRATFEPIALSFLAEAYVGAGDVARARAAAAAAVAASQRRGTRSYDVRARLAQARVLLRSGAAVEEIAPVLDGVAALAAETGAGGIVPYVGLERAELAGRVGDTVGRERELRAARAQFVDMGAPAMVAKIDALLIPPP